MIKESDPFAIWRDRHICDVSRACGKDGFPDRIFQTAFRTYKVNRSQSPSVLAPGSLQHIAQQFARSSSGQWHHREHAPRNNVVVRFLADRHLSLSGDAQNFAVHEIDRARHQRVRSRRVDLLFWGAIPRCAVQDALSIWGELCPVNRAALERELVKMG